MATAIELSHWSDLEKLTTRIRLPELPPPLQYIPDIQTALFNTITYKVYLHNNLLYRESFTSVYTYIWKQLTQSDTNTSTLCCLPKSLSQLLNMPKRYMSGKNFIIHIDIELESLEKLILCVGVNPMCINWSAFAPPTIQLFLPQMNKATGIGEMIEIPFSTHLEFTYAGLDDIDPDSFDVEWVERR